MKLTVKERIWIGNILPKTGNFVDLTVAEDIEKKTKFTQKELDALKMRFTPPTGPGQEGGLSRDQAAEKEINVEFESMESKLLQDLLEGLNAKKIMSKECLSLYKLFCVKDTKPENVAKVKKDASKNLSKK